MIKGVSGVPGSGKTYFVVKEIADKYFEFDKEFSEWKIKEKYKDILIITNIKEFKLNSITFENFMEENNFSNVEQIFSVPFWENWISRNPELKILFLIDEAQKYFPSNYKDNDVLFFFQYHRHLGIDIYLTYQTWASISRKITDLMEFEIRAVRRTLKIANEFRYQFYAGMDRIGSTVRKSDSMVFALYKSFDASSVEKVPSPARKLALLIALMLVGLVFAVRAFLGSFSPETDIAHADPAPPSRSKRVSSSPIAAKSGDGGNRSITIEQQRSVKPVPMIEPSSRVPLGGMWLGNKLIAVEFFGQVVPVREFNYPFTSDLESRKVFAVVPDNILAQVKPVKTGGFYGESGRYRQLPEPEQKAKHYKVDMPDYFARNEKG
jgi:hypothetical protein